MPKHRHSRRGNSLLGLWIGLGVLGGLVFVLLIVLLVTMDHSSSSSSPANTRLFPPVPDTDKTSPSSNTGGFPFVPEASNLPTGSFRVELRNPRFRSAYSSEMFVDIIPHGTPDPQLRYLVSIIESDGDSHDVSLIPENIARRGTLPLNIRIPFRPDLTYRIQMVSFQPRRVRETYRGISNTLVVPGPQKR